MASRSRVITRQDHPFHANLIKLADGATGVVAQRVRSCLAQVGGLAATPGGLRQAFAVLDRRGAYPISTGFAGI